MTAASHATETTGSIDPHGCLNSIQAADATAAAPWVLAEEDQLHGYLYAQRLRRFQRKLVSLARQEDAKLDAAGVTVGYLEARNGRLRRKAEAQLLQQSTLPKREATRLLRLTVNLHQHAPELLDKLEAGACTVSEVEILAQKLAAIQPPTKPTPSASQADNPPDGRPEKPAPEPEDFPQTARRTDNAKDALGQELTKLAGRGLPTEDLRSRAATLQNQHHPVPSAQRQKSARQRRHIRVTAASDGMAHLYALIDAAEAAQIQQRLTAQAQQLRAQGKTADRSPANVEADLLVDRLLGGAGTAEPQAVAATPPADSAVAAAQSSTQEPLPTLAESAGNESPPAATSAPGTTVMVLVTLPELIKLGGVLDPDRMLFLREHYPQLWEQAERNRRFYATPARDRKTAHPPGLLDSGASVRLLGTDLVPGTASSAELVARASVFRAILTDPITGYPLGVGRKSYRVPQSVRELILLRDQTCRHPGCRAPATAAEMDHVTPWVNNGHTGYAEVVAKCAEHHRGKSAGWYQERLLPDDGDGVLEFRDPTGEQPRISRPAFPLDPKAWRAYRAENDEPPPF